FKSILTDGLPPLGGEIGNRTDSSQREDHEDAVIDHSMFTLIKDISLSNKPSLIWQLFENKGNFDYCSETSIANCVSVVLADIVYAMGREKELSFREEMPFRQQRPDIWVVSFHGLPVGIIEIKKPSDKIMDSPQLGGQVFDYLTMLQSFYGIKWHFAIVSTYRQWKIFWLKDTDTIAKSDSVSTPDNLFITNQHQLPDIPLWGGANPVTVKAVSKKRTATTSRNIYASDTIFSDDKRLAHAIASVLHKMASTPRDKVCLVDHNRAYIEMNDQTWKWTDLPSDLKQVKFELMPRIDAPKYICLAYLGSGSEGLVWLATTKSGNGCVIKLSTTIRPIPLQLTGTKEHYNRNTEEERETLLSKMKTEAKNWSDVWGINAQAKIIGGQPALVMPYLQMCSQDELDNSSEIQNATCIAVEDMAKQGYQHADLSQRHVGLYKKVDSSGKCCLHAIFVDLSNIRKIQPTDQVDAVTAMLSDLNL
ncbi:8882_t:CDS:1, partial [Paraglomus occultum]